MPQPDEKSQTRLLQLENQKLRRAVEELSILNDLAREIGASKNSEEIMKKIISRSLRAVHAEQGTITLIETPAHDTMKTLVRSMVSSSEHQPYHLDQALLGWMHLHKKPLSISSSKFDKRFSGFKWDVSIHSLLCVPLLIRSELKGILTVINKKDGGEFNEEDQRLLAIIAAQSAQVVENARLYEEEQALFRIQEELRLANEIQIGLLPKSLPQIPGYDVAGMSIPAQSVGGDYFDFISIDDHRMAFCLGDVSGKGLPAALLMANLQAIVRGQSLVACAPHLCLERANTLLYRSTAPNKFATFFYSILDYQNHDIRYANAGHDRPILFSKNSPPQIMQDAGIALSFLESFDYEESTIRMQPSDTLLVYSDGISEAMDHEENEFGQENIIDFVGQHLDASAGEIMKGLIQAVRHHVGTQPQMDDITLVIVKRT